MQRVVLRRQGGGHRQGELHPGWPTCTTMAEKTMPSALSDTARGRGGSRVLSGGYWARSTWRWEAAVRGSRSFAAASSTAAAKLRALSRAAAGGSCSLAGGVSPEDTMTKGAVNCSASSMTSSSWAQVKGKGVSQRYLQYQWQY